MPSPVANATSTQHIDQAQQHDHPATSGQENVNLYSTPTLWIGSEPQCSREVVYCTRKAVFKADLPFRVCCADSAMLSRVLRYAVMCIAIANAIQLPSDKDTKMIFLSILGLFSSGIVTWRIMLL